MDEKQRKLVRTCLAEYYEEDKRILLDISVTQIACITFLVYNLIFFGNKVIISKETFNKMIELSKYKAKTKSEEIRRNNCIYLLDHIRRDTNNNYSIVNLEGEQYTETKEFLLQNPDTIFYLANDILFEKLIEDGISSKQLYLMKQGMRETDPHEDKFLKFETIGAIQFEKQKMIIYPRDGVIIKVYNSKGIEKTVKEINTKDFVLIKKAKKQNLYSYNLFQVVSKHTRNHAIRIIWTDLQIGEKTNKYIERLPYEYKKIILENI